MHFARVIHFAGSLKVRPAKWAANIAGVVSRAVVLGFSQFKQFFLHYWLKLIQNNPLVKDWLQAIDNDIVWVYNVGRLMFGINALLPHWEVQSEDI
jgi:hypothetical protein